MRSYRVRLSYGFNNIVQVAARFTCCMYLQGFTNAETNVRFDLHLLLQVIELLLIRGFYQHFLVYF